MLYVIIGEVAPDAQSKRAAARPAHLKRLDALQADARLVLAGPFPAIDSPDPGPAGVTGSLIVAAFDSLIAAQSWAESDPYVTEGVYTAVSVRPFCKVLPA